MLPVLALSKLSLTQTEMNGKRPENESPGESNEESRKRQKVDDILQSAEEIMRNSPTTSDGKLNWLVAVNEIQRTAYQLMQTLNSQQQETIRAMIKRLEQLETLCDPDSTVMPLAEGPAVSAEDEDDGGAEDEASMEMADDFDDAEDWREESADNAPSLAGVEAKGASQGFSASIAADDIEGISDLEDDADAAAPTGPGSATQLEALYLDDGEETRKKRLRDLRDKVVKLLRDVPNGDPLPMALRKRALALRKLVQPFMGASEAARRMSGAISELLTREFLDGGDGGDGGDGDGDNGDNGAGPSGVAPAPNTPGAPQGARIVGRATDVLGNGTRRQSFLLFQPPRSYSWLIEADMRADPVLLTILNAYAGLKGDDPTGNGFVVVIVRGRGSIFLREYHVRWTVEPQVPVKYAETHNDGWLYRRQLVNPGMADAFDGMTDAFDQRQHDEDDFEDAGGGTSGPSALKWSPAQGRPLLSMRLAVAQQGGSHLGALWEYTASRLFTLQCRAPPAPGEPGAPEEDELMQLGKDMYEVDQKALDAAFRREREREARDRLLTNKEGGEDGEDEEKEEKDAEVALAAWRREREVEIRADAEARWRAMRIEDAQSVAKLKSQMEAIEALEAVGGDAAAIPVTVLESLSDEAALIVTNWKNDRNKAAASISQPRLRLPRVRDVLSQPSRSAVTDGWLRLLRNVHSDTPSAQRLASAYGRSWPQRPGPTATPPDHVVATRSLRMGAGLIIEHGDPAQNPANLVLCTLSQNSAKSDSVLGLFSAPAEVQGAAGQDVYSPSGVSEVKKAMLAKTVAMMFALYWGAFLSDIILEAISCVR